MFCMKYFSVKEQMLGKILNDPFALGIFSPIFHDLVFGAFPRYSGCLMRSGKNEMTGL